MSETEGVEHVGAGALGGGTMIIRAKFGDVDDSEDLTVFRVRSARREGC